MLLSRIPFLPQLRPIFQPFPDLAFETALGRVVELLAAERLREVVLAGEGVGRIVVVVVPGAVALRFHQPRRRVEDVLGRQQRATSLGRRHGGAVGLVRGVRFWRWRDIDDGMRERQLSLRATWMAV